MWKLYTGSIFDIWPKKILSVIFKTLFTANHPFLDKFSPNLFLVKSPKSFYNFFSKINLELNFDHFWLITYCDLTKKQVLVKIAQKWMICRKQSLKNEKQIFFCKKSKMLPVYGFHIDFQFRPKMLLPRDLWMPQTPRKQ